MSISYHVHVGPYADCDGTRYAGSAFDIDIDEALFAAGLDGHGMNGRHAWLPNFEIDGVPNRSFYPRETDSFASDLAAVDRQAEIDAFANRFAAAIAKLREHYGDDGVRLAWGVVLDVS